MRRSYPCRRCLAAAIVVWLLPSAVAAERLVAIGDIHGAYDELVAVLTAAELIDDRGAWSGGDATLVQTGDFTDRGPGTRQVMDLLRELQLQAAEAGGRVEILMGNHETMNLVGDRRDVSAETLSSWAGETGEDRREEAYEDALRAARARAKLTGGAKPATGGAAKRAWLGAHPEGFVPYVESLLPDGEYGRWLRGLPVATRVGDVVFLHGGLDERVSAQSIDEINRQAAAEIARLDACREALVSDGLVSVVDGLTPLLQASFTLVDQLRASREEKGLETADEERLAVLAGCSGLETWHLFASDGPLWFRGYAEPRSADDEDRWSDEEGAARIAAVLENQGARHVVVGHTPQVESGIGMRFEGRVFLIDTGMLTAVYRGSPAALEIADGVFTAIYPDRREVLLDGDDPAGGGGSAAASTPPAGWTWRGPDGAPLPFASAAELETFLETADVVSRETLGQGVTRPTKMLLEKDGVRAHAIFRSVDVEIRNTRTSDRKHHQIWRDNFAHESAAYEVAKALGLDRVPPVVPRSLDGRDGSLQAWVEDAMREADRLERGLTPPDPLRWAHMQLGMRFFDALINNQDRHQGNSLIDANWNLWFIDHTRSFFVEHGEEAIAALNRVPRPLWDRFRTADRKALDRRLADFLSPAERDALAARWEAIGLHFEALAETRGGENVFLE